jgi:DNA-binding NarL/FixJ family response regulator
MVRVLLVDDHAVVRQGVARILERSGRFEVVGEAQDGGAALDLVAALPADILVLDLDMPAGGVGLIPRLLAAAPGLRILVLSQHAERDFALRCLEAGAWGYAGKDAGFEAILAAVTRIASGRRYLSDRAQELAIARLAGGPSGAAPHTTLSSRELEVLLELARGRRVKEIAADLGISFKTVSTYRTRILEKLDLESNVELALYARDHGLL